MYLSEFLIANYRSCRNIHIKLENDYPNVLIGINDCGKSTILQAIGLLLNPKPKFNFASEDKKKNDISNTPLQEEDFLSFLSENELPLLHYQPQKSIVIGKIVIEETDINEENEEGFSNHLRWAIGKSSEKSLWIARVFSEESRSFTTYLLTPEADEYQGLYKETAATLNRLKRELSISSDEIENVNNVGRFKNIELATAIYSRFTLKPRWAEYPIEKEKNFWVEYRYLDWNITLEQLTQFANDAVNSKITQQIDLASKFAKRQASKAQEIINQELSQLATFLKADLQNIKAIKANINFQVNSVITDLMVEKENSDGDVHLDSQGDGVKRQLWFALMKWKALNSIRQGETDTKFIWCFDEPETHLYPQAQREFFEIIKGVSRTNVQSIISTHSTVFIDRAKLRSINKVDLATGYTLLGQCIDVDDIYQSLQIRNSDFLFYDRFLVVEGDTEQILIPHLYELKFGRKLVTDSIQLINLGGKSKRVENLRILRNIIEGFRKETSSQIVHIFDNDACKEIKPRESEAMNFVFAGKQDIEDSVDSSVWHAIIIELPDGQLVLEIDEIELIKAQIPKAKPELEGLQANQKFYSLLKRVLDKKWQEAGLTDFSYAFPTKGVDSGKLLSRHIKDIGQVCPSILLAFERVRPC